MDVYAAVASRRAVRSFTGEQVPEEVLRRVLSAAAAAPASANMQPQNVYVVTGEPLAALKRRVAARVAAGDGGDEREFEMYPRAIASPYRARRDAYAAARYGPLGIARDDGPARAQEQARNWDCFGAPAALFCYVDREMERPQWADLGIYLQTVMLLLRAEGLHSCPQMAWSAYRRSVAETVSPPPNLVLFCGLSIGFEDATATRVRPDRAPLEEIVTFVH